jgi:tRNA (guanine-N7-)-methyltransferase
MRYLPNYFTKGQLSKLFICFPDPHFKAKNHRRRIVSFPLLTEYAYFIRPGGRLYLITDVLELHEWHVAKVDGHSLFRRVPDEEAAEDLGVQLMSEETEESKKVARCGGKKYWAVYERVEASTPSQTPALLKLLKAADSA